MSLAEPIPDQIGTMTNGGIDARSLPLADWELDQIFDRNGVNDKGRKRVQKTRVSPPARSIRPSRGHITGWFPSEKMGVTIGFESGTCEFPKFLEMERDDQVLEFYDQPQMLSLVYRTKSGGKQRVASYPDILVIKSDYVGFVECKTEEQLEKLARECPGRWQKDPNGNWRSEPGEQAAAAFGLGYQVWSSDQANWNLLENGSFLEDYLHEGFEFPSDRRVQAVRAEIRQHIGITVEELVHKTGDGDAVFGLIAHGKIWADLERFRFSEPDRMRVFLDESHARVWEAASPEELDPPVVRQDDRLEPEQQILKQASEKEREIALERYRILEPVIKGQLKITQIESVPYRTAARWMAGWKQAEREHGCGFLGLLPGTSRRGNREDRLGPEIRELMDKVAELEYENGRQVTKLVAYGCLVDRCQKQALVAPAYQTFCEYLNERDRFKQQASREGQKAALSQAPTQPADRLTYDKQGTRPFDILHIDHTQVDLLLRLGRGHPRDGEIERAWLTIAFCNWSRCVVGYSLSFDPPSYSSCMSVLRDMVQRHQRLPRMIVVDNGREFGSVAFDEFCAAYRIEKRFRPPGEPRYGSECERMFGTINTQLIHALSGNTQLLKNPRQMSADVDPFKSVLWTLPDFDQFLRRYLFECYPNQPHPALGETPNQRFEHGLNETGQRFHKKVEFDRKFFLLTLPRSSRGTAKVNRQTGIQVDGIRYNSPVLKKLHGQKVHVRIDPEDVSRVFVYAGQSDGWIECRSQHYAKLQGRSRREIRLASLKLRKTAGNGRKTPKVTAAALAGLTSDIREHEDLERQRLRDQDRKEATRTRDTELNRPDPLTVQVSEPDPGDSRDTVPESVVPDANGYDETEAPETEQSERPTMDWDDLEEPEEMD